MKGLRMSQTNLFAAFSKLQSVSAPENVRRLIAESFDERAMAGGTAMQDIERVLAAKDVYGVRAAQEIIERSRRDLAYYFVKIAARHPTELEWGQRKLGQLEIFLRLVLIGIPLMEKMAEAAARDDYAAALKVIGWNDQDRACNSELFKPVAAACGFCSLEGGKWHEKSWDEGTKTLEAVRRTMVDHLEGTLVPPQESPTVKLKVS